MKITTNLLWLAVLLLALAGCGEHDSGNKTANTAPSAQVQESTPEMEFARLEKKAKAGNADAQYKLGYMYATGEGATKDAVIAVEWFRKAAAQEYGIAQFSLGWMYTNGEGVPANAAIAHEWFQKAAAHGYAREQFREAYSGKAR